MAAKTAAKNNLKTLLLDEKNEIGGSTIFQNSEHVKINDQNSSAWLENEINELKNIENLEIKTRTSVAAYHGYNYLLARENLTDMFYCPYVPLQMVRAVGENTFQPKIGFKTRYGIAANPFHTGTVAAGADGAISISSATNKYYRKVKVSNLM
jgi:hypothetical protein